ncbi:hypothetical protein C2G38_2045134 [Gigaspora rosea]|uniref:Galactose oxidase n=1 Tax=Gigaspora rosea TaxID=44941 RepID=A0A397UM88_9GLOM|nr:hypothetical protein C2G38_2045134 [Gigaspora rosea]
MPQSSSIRNSTLLAELMRMAFWMIFFYLDVSKQFNTTALPWNNLNKFLPNDGVSACSGGNNNDIFLFSGLIVTEFTVFTVKYDINNQKWTDNITNGPSPRSYISCAKFNNQLIAIFAGLADGRNNPNDLWIFDSLALTWSLSNAPNPPQPIWSYCAITLPDQTILYMGGTAYENVTTEILMPLNSIPLYDSASDMWKTLETSGPTPPSRKAFSAVLSMSFDNVNVK